MPEGLAQLVAELVQAWNAHDLDRVAALYAPEYEGEDVAEPTRLCGPLGIREAAGRYLRAFPDLHLTVEHTVVEGSQAAIAWTVRGTHDGPLLRIPPTGRVVVVKGMSMLTARDGRLTGGLYVWDVAGFLRAIGLLPEL